MGMVTGNRQDYDADIVFATVQTLSKEETLQRYQKDTWDLIIIDDYAIIGLTQESPEIKAFAA